jgi:hypothetical protein
MLFLASVAYVAVLAAVTDPRHPRSWLVGALAIVLAGATLRRTRGVARGAGWGAAVVVASLGAGVPSRALDACGGLGACAAVASACIAVAAMGDDEPSRRIRRSARAPLAVVGIAWALAAGSVLSSGLTVAPAARLAEWLGGHAAFWSALAIATSSFTLAFLVAGTLRKRPLDLVATSRAEAMAALLATVLLAALAAAGFGRFDGEAVARLSLVVASAVMVATARHPDVMAVVRMARRAVATAAAGGLVVILGAACVEADPDDAWVLTAVTALLALAAGSGAGWLERPFRPAYGVLLDACDRAAAEATRADPSEATRGALQALRVATGLDVPSPTLWTHSPGRVSSVDAAGYLHEREADVPPEVVDAALADPDGTVRAEWVDALVVRRPDLRSVGAWLEEQRALLATIVASDGETEGLLVLPRGHRAQPVALDEVRAVRRVADRLAAACRVRSAEARWLDHTRSLTRRAEAAEECVERLAHERALDSGRHGLAAARLARPATVGIYAAASRMALEALERRTAAGAPIAVVAASGVDPVAYLARAHLAGVRRSAPFVVVDATSAREHDLGRWGDPAFSPLALADGGMLVLLDGSALPADVQRLVARSLAEARPPWERPTRLDVQLALTTVEPPRELVTSGRLEAMLAARLGGDADAPVVLPRLQDRPDDLRAVITDRLAREGLRVLGRPVGIEPAAYARLAEHPFPGDDAELSSIVQRLVAHCGGDMVRLSDVTALRLSTRSAEGKRRKDPLSA